ncbi:MAG: MBL fold metallo-hydrolase [Acidobacteria bacterium]|nr:MBL fold metallo-hydrolase [Acidobacteriota bacterium]
MLKTIIAGVALVILPSMAVAQDARAVIGTVSSAMGADNLKTIVYSATGEDFAFGQAYNPTSPWPRFINKSYTRMIDFDAPSSRVDRVRNQAENPPRGGGQQPVRGDQPVNQTIIINSGTPWVQQLEIWMTPYGFLKAARANNATVTSQTIGGKKYQVLTFVGQNKATVNAYVNAQNLIEKVDTHIDNPMLGDVLFEAIYSDYKDVGGVKFPMKIVQKQGGYRIFDLTVNDVKPNAPVSIQAAQGRGGAGGPGRAGGAGGEQAAATPSEKLADGVYLILGGYASVAVDFKDYIVVIEGPQSEERASAIIAEAKRLIPGKPIKYLVNTHHHFDHASGLRTFVAEGATIVTHQVNKAYYERLFVAPHTLNPDKLALSKKAPNIETMTEKRVLTDGNHVVELHHVRGAGHNAGLLVAYFPKEKILVEADAYNPPAQASAPVPMPISPYTSNLMENLDRLKLKVETVIPIHYAADGRKITWAELQRAAGRAN